VDPARDREVIEFEPALADLATVEKRLDRTRRAASPEKGGGRDARAEGTVVPRRRQGSGRHGLARQLRFSRRCPCSPKPVLYAANVTDAELTR
jgi:ribosome-binding ATPase YchF (GTP1/OBG family)